MKQEYDTDSLQTKEDRFLIIQDWKVCKTLSFCEAVLILSNTLRDQKALLQVSPVFSKYLLISYFLSLCTEFNQHISNKRFVNVTTLWMSLYSNGLMAITIDRSIQLYDDPTIDCLNVYERAFFSFVWFWLTATLLYYPYLQ